MCNAWTQTWVECASRGGFTRRIGRDNTSLLRRTLNFRPSPPLFRLLSAEGVELSPGTLQALSKVAGGDMRRAITTLQSAARLGGKGGVVDGATVHDVAGVVPEAACAAIAEACKSGSFAAMQASIEHTVLEGYPVRCVGDCRVAACGLG